MESVQEEPQEGDRRARQSQTNNSRQPSRRPEAARSGEKREGGILKRPDEKRPDEKRPSQTVQITTQPKRISPTPSILVIIPHLSEFSQMESFLSNQIDKCEHYVKVFTEQSNASLASQFETYLTLTQKDLEMLLRCVQDGSRVPRYKFETVRITCVPTNVDVKEKELHIVVKTTDLPVDLNSDSYIVGDFDFPVSGKEESVSESASRWLKSVKIEPTNLVCCAAQVSRQLDLIYSTPSKPFYNMDSKAEEYDRPLRFYVDKGRSRTMKRKFKPIKLTFYQKTNFARRDRRIGTVLVKIDGINDDSTLIVRSPIMNGRKETSAVAEIRVRVREPLVDRSLKTYEEKLLVLT